MLCSFKPDIRVSLSQSMDTGMCLDGQDGVLNGHRAQIMTRVAFENLYTILSSSNVPRMTCCHQSLLTALQMAPNGLQGSPP